ncbi:uncharacterized protein LOC116601453 isoform X2 [Nematostella vectensis]|uniref:uncharacterized protein LOC116601453 isoform X2 n=1 Tax=Nematostella vectensis TaxID=45351 RepID=UPI0020771938|nr:uncharacterized protein LOC116601453 isoform X2 [Nematostella vectensis]
MNTDNDYLESCDQSIFTNEDPTQEKILSVSVTFKPQAQGWKGYGNNIYIQPILVNNTGCEKAAKTQVSKRFHYPSTNQLKATIKTRMASEWVTKHNQRIQLTGSLKSLHSATTDESTKDLGFSKNGLANNSPHTGSKITKGFVCRNWANDFLPEQYKLKDEEEFVPFMVRKYVDRTKYNVNNNKPQVVHASREVEQDNKPTVPAPLQTEEAVSEIFVSISDNTHRQPVSSENQSCSICKKDEDKNAVTHRQPGQSGTNKSRRFDTKSESRGFSRDHLCSEACRCNQYHRHTGQSRSQSSTSTGLLQPKSRIALPFKQFPPIEPLRQSSNTGIPTGQRPQTVASGFIANRAHLTSRRAHSSRAKSVTYANFSSTEARRAKTTSSQDIRTEQIQASRYHALTGAITRAMRSDDAEYIKALRTPHNEQQPIMTLLPDGKQVLRRTFSEHSRLMSLLRCSGVKMESKGFEKISSIETLLYTPAQSYATLIQNSHQSVAVEAGGDTDSEVMGLGSDIAYSSEGSTKLEIYLNARE